VLVYLLVLHVVDALLALLHVAQFRDAVGITTVKDAEGALGDAVTVVLLCRAIRTVIGSVLLSA